LVVSMCGNLVYNLVSAEVVLVSFKITKRAMRPDMSYIRCCGAVCLFNLRVHRVEVEVEAAVAQLSKV